MKVRMASSLAVAAVLLGSVGAYAAYGPASANDSVSPVDRVFEGDLDFYAGLQPGDGVITIPPAESISDAQDQSTVVITAEIEDVVPLEFYPDEPGPGSSPQGGIQTIGVVLRPINVLSGNLQPDLDRVAVEFLAGWVEKQGDIEIAAGLPKGQSIWFLRWQGQSRPNASRNQAIPTRNLSKYALVSFESVFVQGEHNVIAPLSAAENEASDIPDVADEAREISRMSDLAAIIRQEEAADTFGQ